MSNQEIFNEGSLSNCCDASVWKETQRCSECCEPCELIPEGMISMEKHTKQIQSYKTGMDELCKITNTQNDKIEKLEKEVKKFQPYIVEKRLEVKLLKSLVEHGSIFVKIYTQDCDGVESYSNTEFKSIEEYNQGYESFGESIEGRFSWDVVNQSELYDEDDCGTFGQGWGIN